MGSFQFALCIITGPVSLGPLEWRSGRLSRDVASRLARWLDTDTVVHSIFDLLLAAKIAFGGLH